MRIGKQPWTRVNDTTLYWDHQDKCIDIGINMLVKAKIGEKTFICFALPYSYKEQQLNLKALENKYKNDQEIYFNRNTLIKSPEGRKIDLLTISSFDSIKSEVEPYINSHLYPLRKKERQTKKFSKNKLVVFISARVHPGETPSSHVMKGVLNFLLNKKDIRAQILRRHFVFKLIPMINPDGVYHGHYRMDIYN